MTFDFFPYVLCIMGGFTLATVLRSILTKMEADDDILGLPPSAECDEYEMSIRRKREWENEQQEREEQVLLSYYDGLTSEQKRLVDVIDAELSRPNSKTAKRESWIRELMFQIEDGKYLWFRNLVWNRWPDHFKDELEREAIVKRGPSPESLEMVNAIVAEGR